MSNGEEFLQELCKEGPACNIIRQCLRSRMKAMMKRKGKVFVEEHVKKLVKKKIMFKAKKSQKMLQWMTMDSNEPKWAR